MDATEGGGTDAAFAALQTKNAVLSALVSKAFSARCPMTNVLLDSIQHLGRSTAIMDFTQGKVKP